VRFGSHSLRRLYQSLRGRSVLFRAAGPGAAGADIEGTSRRASGAADDDGEKHRPTYRECCLCRISRERCHTCFRSRRRFRRIRTAYVTCAATVSARFPAAGRSASPELLTERAGACVGHGGLCTGAGSIYGNPSRLVVASLWHDLPPAPLRPAFGST
jgi:hypothetical protein